MTRRLLIDTNILLDAAMGERPGWTAATLLVDELVYEDVIGYVSALSLKDVYYVLSKYADERAARSFVLATMDLLTVADVDGALCRLAALSDEPDFEDGIIRACAEDLSVDFIISRDEKAFARSPIRRLSAQEYIDLFCTTEEIDLPD